MKIYEKIREYSKSKGETMKEIADGYGVTPQSIQLYFSGKNAMPLNFLVWYIEKHPELDLYALFNKNQQSIVSEPKPVYNKKSKKQDVIDRIVEILEKEL
ncbi:transcriptional regulator with XRE-family HTH domain [Chryseobacterium sp. SLBN-27]|jgi:transcriptional regulator with XRE-family HTH domain|uniref:helix-turn-helix transcriptional regulator n=1 Tax=Chryseobacterium sp. SLBN-27 TaxID=3042287 RepID=UPI0025875CE7|nr:helix-turn-helix transcriptional regulator [Chryseobacterium sp. SLBN-27]MDR6158281.1 transcriptional regulator with XRE-family HTH domain [Chryseobacterium sp. SLBN-27]